MVGVILQITLSSIAQRNWGVFNAYFLVRTAARIIAGFNLRFQFPLSVVLAMLPVVLLVALSAAWWTA